MPVGNLDLFALSAFERQLDGAGQSHPPDELLAGAAAVVADNAGQQIGAAFDLHLEDEPSISIRAHRRSLPLRRVGCIGHGRLIFSPS